MRNYLASRKLLLKFVLFKLTDPLCFELSEYQVRCHHSLHFVIIQSILTILRKDEKQLFLKCFQSAESSEIELTIGSVLCKW